MRGEATSIPAWFAKSFRIRTGAIIRHRPDPLLSGRPSLRCNTISHRPGISSSLRAAYLGSPRRIRFERRAVPEGALPSDSSTPRREWTKRTPIAANSVRSHAFTAIRDLPAHQNWIPFLIRSTVPGRLKCFSCPSLRIQIFLS